MIDAARRRGFKADAGDSEAKDAQLAKELKDAGERTPRPDTWFSLRRGLRGYASTRSASRPPTARRGRQTTMHDRNDSTSTRKKLSETRVMSTHVQPRFERVDTGNRKTGRRKSISVHPSTPIYILSRSGEERSGETNLPVKERFGLWGGRLDIVSQTNRRVGEICVHPQTPRLDEGGHNSGEVIG